MWAGDAVGLDGLHNWIQRRKPKPELCVNCKIKEPYDLANISGEYKRDVNDFEWLCRKCHMLGDGRHKKWIDGLKKDKSGMNNPNWRGGKVEWKRKLKKRGLL